MDVLIILPDYFLLIQPFATTSKAGIVCEVDLHLREDK